MSADFPLLATGAEPTRLTLPGCDDPGVLVVRSLDHVRELMHRLPDAFAPRRDSGFTTWYGRDGVLADEADEDCELIAEGAPWTF